MKAQKSKLRKQVKARLDRQSSRMCQAKSEKIAQRLFRTQLYREAQALFCYAALAGEVQTRLIMEKALGDGKRVFVPVVTDADASHMVVAEVKDMDQDLAHKGHYGIAQPHPLALSSKEISLKKLDLLVVPGLAFDSKGNRLGRGKGYFDHFFERVPASTPSVGLGYAFQVVASVPQEGHDRSVNKIITEEEVITP